MSSNLAFLLSLIFVISMIAFAGDLCCIQTIYAELDSISISAGKLISRNWGITDEVVAFVNSRGATIKDCNESSHVPAEGDIFKFSVSKEYRPLSFDQKIKNISVNRSIVIGYRS